MTSVQEPTSWAPFGEHFNRTPEQILLDDCELAARITQRAKILATPARNSMSANNGRTCIDTAKAGMKHMQGVPNA